MAVADEGFLSKDDLSKDDLVWIGTHSIILQEMEAHAQHDIYNHNCEAPQGQCQVEFCQHAPTHFHQGTQNITSKATRGNNGDIEDSNPAVKDFQTMVDSEET